MLQRFRAFVAENNLIKASDRVLLAVSGGIDSMVMAHLFLASGYSTGIAHCNFQLRGQDSEHDQQLVSEFAAKNRIPFFVTRFKTKEYAGSNGLSIQMAARKLRYEWFEKIRSENKFDFIAIAHNLNDNIETLIINLVRGTGISGLTGIKISSEKIIRPLLFATREEINEYCRSTELIFREDRSNADTKYIRNKIRHKVIPVLREINPAVEHTLNETTRRLSGINDIVRDYIGKLSAEVAKQGNGHIEFIISRLKPHLDNRSILFELFRQYGISDATLDDLINIINGKTGSWISTGTHRIIRNRGELVVTSELTPDASTWVIDRTADFKAVPEILSARSTNITTAFRIPAGNKTICLDSEMLKFPLIVRRWRSGDYFFPLGMDKKKKLSDFFTDIKYSAVEKENALILESEGNIVAILGERIDNRYRISESSKKALIIKVRRS